MRMGGGRIPTTLFLMLALGAGFAAAGRRGATARYLGGTLPTLEAGISGALLTDDPISLAFECRLGTVRVPYERVNLVEYGQQVDRRVLEALLISPMLVLSKKRNHYVAVSFRSDDGKQHAMLFQVDKGAVRALLVSLEARTGRRVEFMDEEARKAGKG